MTCGKKKIYINQLLVKNVNFETGQTKKQRKLETHALINVLNTVSIYWIASF